jgi:hypothetical protein
VKRKEKSKKDTRKDNDARGPVGSNPALKQFEKKETKGK